jgi:uncharacterized RDD family membrane protein YckC
MASPAPNPGAPNLGAPSLGAPSLGEVRPFPPTAQTLSVPYAALGHRVAAYVIDLIIVFSVMMAAGFTSRIVFAAGIVTEAPPTDPVSLWASLSAGLKLAVLLAYVLTMGPIYFALFESSPWQATFGKRLLAIYVTGEDSQRVSLARSSRRWIARFVCGLFGASLASIILIATSDNRKAVHDYIAHTRVLKGRPTPGGSLGAWRLLAAFGLEFLGILGMYLTAFGAH